MVNAGYEQQVVELVNVERANNNLPPYKRVTLLDEAARYHATDLSTDPAGTAGSPQTIPITLRVIDASLQTIYLPAIKK